MKTNLAIVPPAEPKPLTVAELEAKIDETKKQLIDAVHAGDKDRYRSLKIDQDFYTDALTAAQQREAEASAARKRAEREALKPAAEEAVRGANPELAFAEEIADVEKAIELMVGALRRVPEKMQRMKAAQRTAVELCPKAGVAYAGPLTINADLVRETIGRHVRVAMASANLSHEQMQFFPPIHFASPDMIGRVD